MCTRNSEITNALPIFLHKQRHKERLYSAATLLHTLKCCATFWSCYFGAHVAYAFIAKWSEQERACFNSKESVVEFRSCTPSSPSALSHAERSKLSLLITLTGRVLGNNCVCLKLLLNHPLVSLPFAMLTFCFLFFLFVFVFTVRSSVSSHCKLVSHHCAWLLAGANSHFGEELRQAQNVMSKSAACEVSKARFDS